MEYEVITDQDKASIILNRIRELEAQHYNISLNVDETNDEQAANQIDDSLRKLEKRIKSSRKLVTALQEG